MITADTITDVDLRGLKYAFTFQSPTWTDANAALKGDVLARQRCAARLERAAQHFALTGNSNLYAPSMDARAVEILAARQTEGSL